MRKNSQTFDVGKHHDINPPPKSAYVDDSQAKTNS